MTRGLWETKPDLALGRGAKRFVGGKDGAPRDTATEFHEKRDVSDKEFDAESHRQCLFEQTASDHAPLDRTQ